MRAESADCVWARVRVLCVPPPYKRLTSAACMMQRGERLRVRVRKRVCRVGNVYGYFEFCGGEWPRSFLPRSPKSYSRGVRFIYLFIGLWPVTPDTPVRARASCNL